MPASALKAVILAGGRGRRLRPITDFVPKPLVPVGNAPIIEWQLRYLRKHGIREAIVCTGYKTEQLEDRLARSTAGVRVSLSVEREPLGTGGAIKKAARGISDRSFIVINGDVITDIDVKRMQKTDDSVASVPLRTKFGVMEADGDVVSRFSEKKELAGTWMNAGIYHLRKASVRDLPARGDIERTLFPAYAKKGRLRTVKFPKAVWHSIDSFRDLEECSAVVGQMGL